MSSDLASRLREGTKQSHTVVENTAFMQCFLKGIVEKHSFRTLIANLYFIYSALEVELQRHIAHPVVGMIWFPELHRQQNLEQDLAFYYGEDWRQEIEPSQSTNAYVARIHEVGSVEPVLLVAHAYIRYMGDLSGGQSLKAMVRSSIQLPPDKGTALYEFESLPTAEARKAFKGKYRHALNSLPVEDDLSQRMIDEANYAFELNHNIFHELEMDVKAAIGEDVFNLIVSRHNTNSTNSDTHNVQPGLMAMHQ
ncbi:MAG: heme oxygenase (biliverdin-producing) [Calothrix sp. MO_167.B12]|nr:heme oxygenase (biliverdin-producing) [Calothrix sp. MO_167.B12]